MNSTARPPSRFRFSLRRLLFYVTIIAFVCGVLVATYNWIDGQREYARQMQMAGHFKYLALAIHNHHDHHQVLPRAVTYNADGEAAFGWRIAIAYFVEQHPIFDDYDRNAAWNSPQNASLCNYPQWVYERPNAKNLVPYATNIVAVTGKGTLFPDVGFASLADVKDDPATTIMLGEIDHSDILWYEPRDLHIDQMSFLINDPDRTQPCIGNQRSRGAWVAMADGSVKFLPQDTPPETLKAMLTIAGGEKVTLPGVAK